MCNFNYFLLLVVQMQKEKENKENRHVLIKLKSKTEKVWKNNRVRFSSLLIFCLTRTWHSWFEKNALLDKRQISKKEKRGRMWINFVFTENSEIECRLVRSVFSMT